MKLTKSNLLTLAAVSLVGAVVVVGCDADGGTDGLLENLASPDSGSLEEDEQPPSDKLPGSGGGADSGPRDAGNPVKNDAGNHDDDAGGDAGTDAGVDAGNDAGAGIQPGDSCAVQDLLTARSCGMCGTQKAICLPGDGGLAWTSYGPCSNEVGTCLPGTSRGCGNCGTQTCTNSCAWSACTGEPASSCSPGSVDRTTAGCPTPEGGFRSRACSSTCQWNPYSLTCAPPTATNLFAGVGAYSTYMRGSDGTLYAWGRDWQGMLGDGETANPNRNKITGAMFDDVVSLQAGGALSYGFACASFGNGSAKCWGSANTSNTLGDGTTSISQAGVTPIGFNANVVQMVAGNGHACGLFADGSAKCWGPNDKGQLGSCCSTSPSKTPITVSLTGITRLASGYDTVCARKGDAAYCWGSNFYGQVGDGTTTNKPSPTLVIPSGVASLAPGYQHSCAAMADGTAKCWGQNTSGELGTGTGGLGNSPNITTPATVVGTDGTGSLSGVADVCTGAFFSCARLNDGRVACWGINNYGALATGNTTPANSTYPRIVNGITSASKLACGFYQACAIDGDKVKCWGGNQYGQIGNGDSTTAYTPAAASW